jgi:hypothetical protein
MLTFILSLVLKFVDLSQLISIDNQVMEYILVKLM